MGTTVSMIFGLAIAPALSGSALAQDFTIEGELALENVRPYQDDLPGVEEATVTCTVCKTSKCGPDERDTEIVAIGKKVYPVTDANMDVDFSVTTETRGNPALGRFYACSLTVSGWGLPFQQQRHNDVKPGRSGQFVYARTQGTPTLVVRGPIE
jgi:hypothetical protein